MNFDAKKFEREIMNEVKRGFKRESAQIYFDGVKSQVEKLISENDAELRANPENCVVFTVGVSDLIEQGLEFDEHKFLKIMQHKFPSCNITMNKESEKIKYSIFYK